LKKEPSPPDTHPAFHLFEQLLQTSNAILLACNSADPDQILALLAQRGRLLDEAGKMNLTELEPTIRGKLMQKMDQINALEPRIQQQLERLKANFEVQIQQNQTAKTGLAGYRLESDNTDTTRSNDA
jgi:hypothetical protein